MSEIKYEKVKDSLKKIIKSGKYTSGDKLPTESELMKEYGVSRYTIRRAAGELENEHYIYRIQGGGMYVDDWEKEHKHTANSKMIGVITTHFADYIFPRIISGIDRVLSENGYSLLLSNTHNNIKQEKIAVHRMLSNQVDGLIIEPTQSALPDKDLDCYREISKASIPALFLNSHFSQINFPYLEVNDSEVEETMVNHLIEIGHRKILGIFQVDDMQGTHRLQGFLNAYLQHPDISYLGENIMYHATQDMTPIFNKVVGLLQNRDEKPTAIVCYNDQLAIQIMNVVKSIDLRIPDDISIVGFDDYYMGRYVLPRLTTIAHPKEKMGIDAAKMILKMINGESVKSKVYHLTPEYHKSIRSLKD